MKLIEIKEWSDERLITQNTPSVQGYNAMIVEELFERMVKGIIKNDENEKIDAIDDVTVFAVGEIYKYGYDAEELCGSGNIKDWISNFSIDDEFKQFTYIERIVIYLGYFLEAENDYDRVSAMKNMIVDSYITLGELGYDADKCMSETMKELNSRTGAYCEDTKKWQKFKTPEAKALWYSADYSNCKL